MAVVRDLLARKGTDVVSIAPTATVLDAARLMNDRSVGGVLVVNERNQLLGIFTERDILRRVVAAERDPATTKVNEVFTQSVVTCNPQTSVDECGVIMSTRRVRHLPVTDEGGLHGVVTIGDLLAHRVAILLGVSATMGAFAMFAALAPARMALRISPTEALQSE